jgi:hypothetical protein
VTEDDDHSDQVVEFASQQRARAAADESWRQLKALFDTIDMNLQHARECLLRPHTLGSQRYGFRWLHPADAQLIGPQKSRKSGLGPEVVDRGCETAGQERLTVLMRTAGVTKESGGEGRMRATEWVCEMCKEGFIAQGRAYRPF